VSARETKEGDVIEGNCPHGNYRPSCVRCARTKALEEAIQCVEAERRSTDTASKDVGLRGAVTRLRSLLAKV
jgi:hypothetical protein